MQVIQARAQLGSLSPNARSDGNEGITVKFTEKAFVKKDEYFND